MPLMRLCPGGMTVSRGCQENSHPAQDVQGGCMARGRCHRLMPVPQVLWAQPWRSDDVAADAC